MPSIRTILWSVNVALLALMAYSAAVFASMVVEGVLVDNTPRQQQKQDRSTRRAAASPQKITAFAAFLDTNIFRAERSQATIPASTQPPGGRAAPEAAQDSDKFPIPITLTGTVAMNGSSIAFVADGGGRSEKVYHLSDCIPSNEDIPTQTCGAGQAKLTKVGSDNIEVELNNRRYVVTIGDNSDKSEPEKPRGNASPKGRRERLGRVTPPRPGKTAPFPSTRTENGFDFRLPNAEVQKAFENFSGLMNDARVVPHMVDGKADGFQIQRIRPGSVFEQIGLQDKDVLKNVNGESLTTADQALRLFTVFRNEREINLEIIRGGKNLNMSYQVE